MMQRQVPFACCEPATILICWSGLDKTPSHQSFHPEEKCNCRSGAEHIECLITTTNLRFEGYLLRANTIYQMGTDLDG